MRYAWMSVSRCDMPGCLCLLCALQPLAARQARVARGGRGAGKIDRFTDPPDPAPLLPFVQVGSGKSLLLSALLGELYVAFRFSFSLVALGRGEASHAPWMRPSDRYHRRAAGDGDGDGADPCDEADAAWEASSAFIAPQTGVGMKASSLSLHVCV